MEFDLETGWAYKLLSMFGRRRELTLENDCTAGPIFSRTAFLRPHSSIKANYVGELRISRRPVFKNSIRQLMMKFDIPDTAELREGHAEEPDTTDVEEKVITRRLADSSAWAIYAETISRCVNGRQGWPLQL